ncbi:MAG: hypothetical protein GWM98_00215 [Nitrospinaceae bacterium]|nr:hypothetical protein [Nitrospinaceae bacterium]NIR53234.1 hypothetical protein [Nitrospinaceae bacterium]NIS83629.1 hypothetical protein [Nitrospinaceae bacterium]NIT80419.1 hypothetical protein [Nitrospinaceae bacterium]NIU94820.1 hypothetical protein [Nitrospinaceae bacterium]
MVKTRKKEHFLWAVVVLILLAGCASAPTYHRIDPAAGEADLDQDMAACESVARSKVPVPPTFQDPVDFRGILHRRDPAHETGLWQARHRVFLDCMRKKGWEKD